MAYSYITQVFAEVLRSDDNNSGGDIPLPRSYITQVFVEVLRSDANAPQAGRRIFAVSGS